MAAVFDMVAKKSLTRVELYDELHNFFSGFALELLHSLESNHLVAIALEVRRLSGNEHHPHSQPV